MLHLRCPSGSGIPERASGVNAPYIHEDIVSRILRCKKFYRKEGGF